MQYEAAAHKSEEGKNTNKTNRHPKRDNLRYGNYGKLLKQSGEQIKEKLNRKLALKNPTFLFVLYNSRAGAWKWK